MSFLERHKERITHWGDNESQTNDGFDHFKTGIRRDSHLAQHYEAVSLKTHTTRFETIGLFMHSSEKHASYSSNNGERAIPVKDGSTRCPLKL